ncbi:hypothetical protein LY76DRAFT_595113, partial [Colletotrichum caudatum]
MCAKAGSTTKPRRNSLVTLLVIRAQYCWPGVPHTHLDSIPHSPFLPCQQQLALGFHVALVAAQPPPHLQPLVLCWAPWLGVLAPLC